MSQLTETRAHEIQSQNDLELLQQQAGVDVWGILSRRKWLVILGLILGLGLAYIYLLQADPIYESVAQVLIEDRKPPSLPLTGFETQFSLASEEAKHAIVLKSPRILLKAYEDFNLERLPTFADSDEAVNDLNDNLEVELVEEGTNVLNVSFRGPNPDDTQTVVSSVLTTYRKFLEETYKDTGEDTRDLIVRVKDEMLERYNKLSEDYRTFRATTPLMWRGEEAINLHVERQADYELERVKLQKQLAELKSRAAAIQDGLENGRDLDAIVMSIEQDGGKLTEENNYPMSQARDKYMMLVMEEQELTRRYGPDHPDLVSVRDRIKKFEEMFPEIVDGSLSRKSSNDLQTLVTSYLGALQQKQTQINNQFENLNEMFKQESEAAKTLQSAQAEDERFRDEIARTQQLIEVTIKSLEQINIVSDSSYEGYNFESLADALAGEKVAPMPYKVLPIGAILGSLAGFGLAYLVDIADKAFRTPDEVSQVMRLPVVGHIPLIDTSSERLLPGSNVSPVIVTIHRPKSPQAESYRAVRTALYFNNREQKHQVIQVTSPMPGDGKSTLAVNLAVTIAQSGKSVLIMDADFRRPTLHKVLGIDKLDVGLASVVSGDTDPADAMQTLAEAPNLRVMACGPRPSNPSELLSSEQFEYLLDTLRQQFDFVIIDTPPVLAVSDPCAVAARVDGVILTFRIHKRARPLATRARDALTNIGATVIGVVVNGVDQEAGGYYSQYRYGYSGYRYAYNYRYGYGQYGSEQQETKAIKTYFDDDRAHVPQ